MAMSPLVFRLTNDNNVSVTTSVKTHVFGKAHPNFEKIVKLVRMSVGKSDDVKTQIASRIDRLADIPKAVTRAAGGKVTVTNGTVLYNGQPIHHAVVDEIVRYDQAGLPFDHLARFLERLLQNPSKRSIDQVWGFVSKHGLNIDEDGYVLGLRRVNDNWKDFHTGTIDNKIGAKPSMPRNQVSDDPNDGCSHGFHFGAAEYVSTFHGGQGHVIVVRVDPADIVCVPYDEHASKVRCCAYEVVREHIGEVKPLEHPVYARDTATPVQASEPSAYHDDDFDDELEEDDDDLDDDPDLDDDAEYEIDNQY